MKKLANIVLCTTLITLVSCNEYDFDQEQFKKEVNLLSNNELVYDRQVATLRPEGDTIFLVAGLSGSQPSTESYTVGILESDSLLKAYNKSNFDIEKDRFAKLLPTECYTFPNMQMEIAAGTSQVRFPVHLKSLEKLSPDTIYFLDYKIDSLKTWNYNPKKRHILLRIHRKNNYATTQENTFYNYTSSTVVIPKADGSAEVRRPTNANRVFPLTQTSVRLLAGDEDMGDYKKALNNINKKSIVLEVGKQLPENPLSNELIIKPYKTIDVVQLTPIGEYDNTYLLNIIKTPDGRATYYKEFRLHYKYRIESTDLYREVKAKLRFEFNPRADKL